MLLMNKLQVSKSGIIRYPGYGGHYMITKKGEFFQICFMASPVKLGVVASLDEVEKYCEEHKATLPKKGLDAIE